MSFPDTDPWDSSAPQSAQASKSNRGLFGKRKPSMAEEDGGEALELRLRSAEGRAQAAESKVSHLESELRSYDEAISSLKHQVESLVGQAGPGRLASLMEETAKDDPLVPDWDDLGEGAAAEASFHELSAELAGIMTGAEDRAAQIIARAWTAAQTRAEQVDRMREDVRHEIDQLTRWREEVGAAMRALVGDMEEAKATIEEIPERVRLALAPAADAMAVVDERMSRLARTTVPLTGALPGEEDDPVPESDPEGTLPSEPESEVEPDPDDAAASADLEADEGDPQSEPQMPTAIEEPQSSTEWSGEQDGGEREAGFDPEDPGPHGPDLEVPPVLEDEHQEAIAAATETLSVLAGGPEDNGYDSGASFGSA